MKLYTDFTIVKENPISPPDSTFVELLRQTVIVIGALELFRSVGIKVRESETIACPSCVVYPSAFNKENQLTGGTVLLTYTVGLAVAIKHPNDCIAMQQALEYIEAMTDRLIRAEDPIDQADKTKNILLFESVAGHYNTEFEQGRFGDTIDIGANVLAFNAGLNIVYSVQKTK